MNASTSQMTEEVYLKDRVDDQLKYYETAANKTKTIFNRMQLLIIVFGLLVPVAINFPVDLFSTELAGTLGAGVQLSVTIMSLIVAILTGILNFKKYGDLWLSYRMTEELLKHEKFTYLTRSGKYASDDAFGKFVQTIESLISHEHNKFHSLIQDSKRPTAGAEQGAV